MNSLAETSEFSIQRQQMVNSQLRGRGVTDERVLEAMSRVPRHAFIPERYVSQSYEDHPLPIGDGQTISQPYIVALMLAALTLAPTDRVLEVGTGSGYVTALLAELTAQVFSVERHPGLANAARDLLVDMGYANVEVIVGDGSEGFPKRAPYEVIIVSAVATQLPQALVKQLTEGGRMIIPVGTPDSQQLQLIRREGGQPRITLRELCRFVPLVTGDRC